MIEVLMYILPQKKFSKKVIRTSLEVYKRLMFNNFKDNFKRMIGLLPQQQLTEFSIVRIRRRLVLEDEVKNVDIDLTSIKKWDDILIAVGVDPKDPEVKRVIIEQVRKSNVNNSVVYTYRKIVFIKGITKLRVQTNIEIIGTFNNYIIKTKNDLMKESMLYVYKKVMEKINRRPILISEFVEKFSNKRVLKIEMTFKSKTENYSEVDKKSVTSTSRVHILVVEH